jgi:hypothetical protein
VFYCCREVLRRFNNGGHGHSVKSYSLAGLPIGQGCEDRSQTDDPAGLPKYRKGVHVKFRLQETFLRRSIGSQLPVMMLFVGLVPGFSYAQSCKTDIAGYVTFLQQSTQIKSNTVTAFVASNSPLTNAVTYAAIPLKAPGGLFQGSLFDSSAGTEYFSNKTYSPQPFDTQPFSPTDTKTITLTIGPDGTVSAKPSSASSAYTFKASCNLGVMYGFVTAPALSPLNAMYTITFRKSTIPLL